MDRVASSLNVPARRPQGRGILPTLIAMLSLHRERRALARLDDAALVDLGLSRAEAEIEAARPIWDAPVHWSR